MGRAYQNHKMSMVKTSDASQLGIIDGSIT
jgi:hypothetical protein